jgi:hypothetical protein
MLEVLIHADETFKAQPNTLYRQNSKLTDDLPLSLIAIIKKIGKILPHSIEDLLRKQKRLLGKRSIIW